MKIILFTHPHFSSHQSMPRFAQMILNGMKAKGHDIVVWSPRSFFYKLSFKQTVLEKWLGYLDQFIVFPIEVKIKLLNYSKESLFVFADNALGPWVPLVKNKPHVIHCHDFLAQKSAFGLLQENKTGKSGYYYQKFIRWGYRKANNFVCISKNTQTDLLLFITKKPKVSKVVYNGLNQNFEPTKDKAILRLSLSKQYDIDLTNGYVLHVGGNAFYKNKIGVLEIYDQWKSDYESNIPLILVGESPSESLINFKENSAFSSSIYFITNTDDLQLQQFYQGASVMVFPSLYEGFGWPIIEAMASGSLVITTNENPMKEIAADVAFYIDKKPFLKDILYWKKSAAKELEKVMKLDAMERETVIEKSILHSNKFSTNKFIDSIESIYQEILNN